MFGPKRMSRRDFIKVSLAAGGLLATGSLWRAVESGVFSTSEGPAYEAWKQTNQGLEALIGAAILAANAHNAQPWFFKLGNSTIDIMADPSRNLGAVDPYLREMYISLGCALENLIVAAKVKGFSPSILYFPNKPDLQHAAKIDLAKAQPLSSELYEAIPRRHMNRGPFDTKQPISQQTLSQLLQLNTNNSKVKLFVFNSSEDKLKIGEAMIDAAKALIADKDQADVDLQWMRQSWSDIQKYKDGITTDSQGLSSFLRILSKILPPLSLEKTDEFWLNTLKNTHIGTAAVYGFIAVRDLKEYEQVVKAGQLWQRIHLWGTAKGIGMHIMNQLSERRDRELSVGLEPHFGDRLRDILGDSQWNSIIQFRMGYPTREALPSPRRPVADVII